MCPSSVIITVYSNTQVSVPDTMQNKHVSLQLLLLYLMTKMITLRELKFVHNIFRAEFDLAHFKFAHPANCSYFQPIFENFLPNFIIFSPFFEILYKFTRNYFSRSSGARKIVPHKFKFP